MKTILTVTALLVSLSAPAFAEEAAAPAPAAQATAPAAEQIVPAALPQTQAPDAAAMSVPDSEAAMTKSSGGCGHSKQVYLTN